MSGLLPEAATRKPSTCGCSLRVRSGLLPHEDRASDLVGPVRSKKARAAQAVPGGEALSTKMGDARAEHAPEGLADPAVAWGTLGAHVVNAKGAHGALEWGVVSGNVSGSQILAFQRKRRVQCYS